MPIGKALTLTGLERNPNGWGSRARPGRVRKVYKKKMATDEGCARVGGVIATIVTAKIGTKFEFLQKLVPGSNPQKVDNFFFS